ncbi:MAG: hypothetical protein LM580_08970, partial [Thermofilum sp.]|nr:hypothetical protein [Thermofilum sp.]
MPLVVIRPGKAVFDPVTKAPSVIVWVDGGVAYAKDSTGRIIAESSDHASVIQAAVNAALGGGTVFIRRGRYYLSKPVSVTASTMKIAIVGEGPGFFQRTLGTVISPAADFPSQNYFFDFKCTNACSLRVADIMFYNDKTGIEAGGLRWYYSGLGLGYTPTLLVERCTFHYMWRAIHMLGEAAFSIRDVSCMDANAAWSGDADLILERNPDTGGIPKMGWVVNWVSSHIGQVNNAMRLDCGYCSFRGINILGGAPVPNSAPDYLDAAIRLGNTLGAWSNKFTHVNMLDIQFPDPVIIFDGVNPSNPSCYDNVIDVSFPNTKIVFRNNAFNNVVRMSLNPSTPMIDDAGAYYDPASGLANRVEIISRHQALSSGYIPPPDAARVIVIDRRFDGLPYSESKSVAVGTGGSYGSATLFRPRSYRITLLQGVKITWGGTFAVGETVTVKITAVYRDGTSYYVEKSATATGSLWL